MLTDQNTDPTEIARENLRLACALRRMSQGEVAEAAGMSRNGLSQFTSGRTRLSYSNMLAICDVLGVPIGIMHKPDAITPTQIRLAALIDRLPDHLLAEAVALAEAQARDQQP